MTKHKNLVNEILVYDTILNEFHIKYPEHVPVKHLPGRKDYASFMIDNYFYFHGGIDSNDQTTNDFIKLNLDNLVWEQINLIALDKPPKPEVVSNLTTFRQTKPKIKEPENDRNRKLDPVFGH